MFWNKTNTKKIEECLEEVKKLRREVEALKLDVEIYHAKLKKVKNVKPVQQEESETQDIKDSVLLPDIYGYSKKFG